MNGFRLGSEKVCSRYLNSVLLSHVIVTVAGV